MRQNFGSWYGDLYNEAANAAGSAWDWTKQEFNQAEQGIEYYWTHNPIDDAVNAAGRAGGTGGNPNNPTPFDNAIGITPILRTIDTASSGAGFLINALAVGLLAYGVLTWSDK